MECGGWGEVGPSGKKLSGNVHGREGEGPFGGSVQWKALGHRKGFLSR